MTDRRPPVSGEPHLHVWKREYAPNYRQASEADDWREECACGAFRSGTDRTECRHPSVHPIDPWPDGPAWACDRCGVSFSPEASTGAALDVLRDLFVAMQAEPVVHGTDRFHHDRWMRWSRDTFMPAWNAAAECIARIAEQEGDR